MTSGARSSRQLLPPSGGWEREVPALKQQERAVQGRTSDLRETFPSPDASDPGRLLSSPESHRPVDHARCDCFERAMRLDGTSVHQHDCLGTRARGLHADHAAGCVYEVAVMTGTVRLRVHRASDPRVTAYARPVSGWQRPTTCCHSTARSTSCSEPATEWVRG
jgi:hypothetical protein